MPLKLLKDELQKAKVHLPISASWITSRKKSSSRASPLDASSTVRGIVSDRLPEYDVVAGPDNSWILTMKPQAAG